jgi:hypothetical protein
MLVIHNFLFLLMPKKCNNEATQLPKPADLSLFAIMRNAKDSLLRANMKELPCPSMIQDVCLCAEVDAVESHMND